MRHLLTTFAVMLVFASGSLWAQDQPKAEVFGGFSIYTLASAGDRTTSPGWQASVAGHLTPRFSVVGDFGGQYEEGDSVYQFLGGARVTERMEKASLFGHALFGGSRFGGEDTVFTMAYGGGVDVNATDRIGIRVIQFDWLPLRSAGRWFNNSLRFGFGVVYKFGS